MKVLKFFDFKDFKFESFLTGFIVCLVGYASSAILVFEAARSFGLTSSQASSWLGVLCIAMGILTIFFSIKYKIPYLFAWSTPGAALLLNLDRGTSINFVIGAFVFSGLLIFLSGATGYFERVLKLIPISLAHAMLAGVLFKFVLAVFSTMTMSFVLGFSMFITYLICRKFWQRYTILFVMLVGILVCAIEGSLHSVIFDMSLIKLNYIMPQFNLKAILNIGVPLFIVTMTSQNMTGIAALHSHGYEIKISKIISSSGLMNLIIAPFGGFAINMAALTASICISPETNIDKEKRYTSAVASGIFYILIGLFSSAFSSLFSIFPKEMIAVLTGIALFGAVGNGLTKMVLNEEFTEAALITFFVTASGVVLFGVGSAFWGIIFGVLTHLIYKIRAQLA